MQRTSMLTAAIAVAVMTSGIAMLPVQAIVAPDCAHDDDVPDDRQLVPITLGGSEKDVWRVIVTNAGGAVDVRVSLDSLTDEMNFGVFYLDGTACDVAADQSFTACDDDMTLSTHGQLPPDDETCTLAAPGVNENSRSYFFVLVNVESDSLDYTIWLP